MTEAAIAVESDGILEDEIRVTGDNVQTGKSKESRSREWKCDTCCQAFTKKEHLIRHVRSHTKERPFVCSVCSKSYGRHDSLIRHARKHATRMATASRQQEDEQREDEREARSPRHMSNAQSLSNGEVSNQVAMGSTLGLSQPEVSASFDPALDDSAGITYGHDLHNPGTHSGVFGPLPNVEAHMPDNLMNFSPMNVTSGADESFWLLPGDFYQTLQTFAVPTPMPQDGDVPCGLWNDQTQPSDVTGPHQTGLKNQPRTESWKAVHERWYTRPSMEASSPAQSQSLSLASQDQSQDHVDETYRAGLSHRLKPTLRDNILPPADFLNLSIKMYFSKFHSLFPIIHASSFSPSSENALLLLSICSIGALFIGSASARARGRGIFLRLNKAILASWEVYLYQGGRESLAVAQAVILGQTFGILSGDPNDLLLTESFHGTIIAWARQAGIFRLKNALNAVDIYDKSDLESTWRTWVQAEESARVQLALHIHDAKFSAIFHHEPFLRHEPERLPVCCSEAIFGAPTAIRWHEVVVASRPPIQETLHPDHLGRPAVSLSSSLLNAYASLAGICASVSEARSALLNEEKARHLRRSLMLWAHEWSPHSFEMDCDVFCLAVLWHDTFMSLYADFDLLERAIGREGTSKKDEDVSAVRNWTSSIDGKRCAAHAVLILKRLEAMPFSSEPAIHVPIAAFHAGVVLYSYIQLAESGPEPIEFDISELPYSSQKLAHMLRNQAYAQGQRIEAPTLSALADLLRRQGHWGLSRRFASILEVLVDEIADSGDSAC